MADPTKQLLAKYSSQNRYANFGHVIREITINGFRGITNLNISLDFPITAFSGLNGAGKSTIGQLAVCAYKVPDTSVGYKRYYVKDFFPVSVVDPSPFSNLAKVLFVYETTDPRQPKEVTVARASSQWSGYKRQPEKFCYYVGFTLYIPKVEHRDLSIYRGTSIELRESRYIQDSIKAKVGQILNMAYDELLFQGIGHKDRDSELGLAQRYGSKYSENNMGFGEGRVLYMIDMLEEVPEQSLFILEEPETSLHEDAQYRLAKYLLDVCNRRHHQIILSTHSSIILEALPSESRKLLYRDVDGVTVYPGISATRARAILSGGYKRALHVCVEDDFARLVVTEIVRRFEPSLLKAVTITPIGSKDAVLEAVRLLKKLGQTAVGIRDGDVGAGGEELMFCLPGARPPEKEVYTHLAVTELIKSKYGFNVSEYLATNTQVDHHEITNAIAEEISILPDALKTMVVQCYVQNLDEGVCRKLYNVIQQNA